MRAVVCNSFGPLDQLTIEERETPTCGPDALRIEVSAAGVNFVDALLAQGLYQVKPPLPFVPGSEVAGTVVELGAGVDSVALGDRVLATGGLAGGFAEQMIARANQVMPAPTTLSDGQVATFFQSYMTAWFALRERARAEAGQTVLVLGAGSGIGLAAVDVARALGLTVIAAASSAEKRDLARALGAAEVIDTSSENVKERAKALSGGGVELVYDPVGGDLAEQGLRALADDGQLLVLGFASGTIPRLPANQVLLRNRRVTGVDWGGWIGKHQERNAELIDEVLAMIEAGDLRPVEPTTYPLDDVVAALSDLANRRVTGKIALIP
ncbi:MAG: NADPH:quinone oxidoreductase family protein [Acidimicrobiia bacterium]